MLIYIIKHEFLLNVKREYNKNNIIEKFNG